MSNQPNTTTYSQQEEQLNIYTHGFGLFMSILGLFLFILKAWSNNTSVQMLSVIVFGVSLCLLYAASTLYHSTTEPIKRNRRRILDHAAIYVLIAGSYTPFTLVTLGDTVGWNVFIAIWTMAFIGVSLKLFFTGKFDILSTIMYVFMGWTIIFAINPLLENCPTNGLYWLFAGGISYTLGAILYSFDRLVFNHAIFHVFVLIGSFCHYWAAYWYVLN